MKRTPKEIKQQTEEWLDERWFIANMKDARPQDMSYCIILEAEKETEKSQNIVSQSIGYTNVSKDSKVDTDDISDLVDDIFG